MTVELHESTKTLAEMIDFASSGEEVVVMRDGKPVARVIAVKDAPHMTVEQASKRFGFLKDKGYRVPDDIKTPFKKRNRRNVLRES